MSALAPKGGNDNVYTPDWLAHGIVNHFKPKGTIHEPCYGGGAFARTFDEFDLEYTWSEIDQGKDFLEWYGRVDWIITNPPWSKFLPFLIHSMKRADNVVFLSLINAWFMRRRQQEMRAAGFGMVEILELPMPPKPWPQTGFCLGAVHIQRGYTGPIKYSYLRLQNQTL